MKSILRSIFYLPGVVTHELSHHIFCIICNVKVTDVCYYNFKNSSGYVQHERPKHLYQDILIATAPFFINTYLGSLIAHQTILNKASTVGLPYLNLQNILRIIISISIGMHAIPSRGDALSIWNYVEESNINWLFKIIAKLIISPLVLVIRILNLLSSFLKIDLFYGICVFLFGPRLIESMINLDFNIKLIQSIQSQYLLCFELHRFL